MKVPSTIITRRKPSSRKSWGPQLSHFLRWYVFSLLQRAEALADDIDRKADLSEAGCGEPSCMARAGSVGSEAEDGQRHRALGVPCFLETDEVSSFVSLKFGPWELDVETCRMPGNKHL